MEFRGETPKFWLSFGITYLYGLQAKLIQLLAVISKLSQRTCATLELDSSIVFTATVSKESPTTQRDQGPTLAVTRILGRRESALIP